MAEQKPNIFLRRKRLFFILIISGFLFLGLMANKWRQDLTLTKIKVEGANLQSIENVIKATGIKLSAGLYEYDLKDIEERVCKNSFIRTAVVSRNLPSSIDIHVYEREPVALIITDKCYYIDKDKKLIPYNYYKELLDLPLITGIDDDVNSKDFANDLRIDSLINLLVNLKTYYIDMFNLISEINIKSRDCIIINTINGGIPLLLGNNVEIEKIINFRSYWNKYSIYNDRKNIEFIDLRFRNQVIVKKRI